MVSSCNICSDRLFHLQLDVSALRCGHTFHRTCLDPWWARNKTCPNCRTTGYWKIDKLFFELVEEESESSTPKLQELENNAKKSEEERKQLLVHISDLETERAGLLVVWRNCRAQSAGLEEELNTQREENKALQAEAEEKTKSLQSATKWFYQLQTDKDQSLEKETEKNKRLERLVSKSKLDSAECQKNLSECLVVNAKLKGEIRNRRKEIADLETTVAGKTELLQTTTKSLNQSNDFCQTHLDECLELRNRLTKLQQKNSLLITLIILIASWFLLYFIRKSLFSMLIDA